MIQFCRKSELGRQHVFSYRITYRSLQILSARHNSAFRQPIMPALVAGVTACGSFGLYVLITTTPDVPLPVIILFWMVAVQMVAIIVVPFKMLANPFVRSVGLLKYLQLMTGSAWAKRFVRSCPPSKFTLGDGNFFDRATSLVIWRKCVDVLITFLLM